MSAIYKDMFDSNMKYSIDSGSFLAYIILILLMQALAKFEITSCELALTIQKKFIFGFKHES